MPEAIPHLLHPGEMTVETVRQGLSYKVVLGLRCTEGPVRVLHLVGDVADVTRAGERDEEAPAGPLGWKLKMTHLIAQGSFHGLIRLEDVLAHTQLEGSTISATGLDATLRQARARFERDYIAAVLQHHRGRIADAARVLGVQRTNLYRKLRKLNLMRPRR